MTTDPILAAREIAPALSAAKLRGAGAVFATTFGSFVSVTPAIVAVLGVYLKPIAEEFGWSRAAVAGALAACALSNALACPFAGKLADRIGPRKTALIGNVLLALSLLLISQVPANLSLYYLGFVIAGAVGAMPSILVFAKILSEWFDRTRGFWLGFSSGVGNGGGAFLFPMFAAAILASHGWRQGFLADGAFVLLAGFPVMYLFLREPPARIAQQNKEPLPLEGMTYREAMRSPLFWWIFSILPLGAGCMTAMFSTIVPLLTDRGVSIDSAVMAIQAFALTTMFVEPGSGWLADRTSSPKIIAPLFLTAAVGLWMLLHVHSEALILLAGALIGVGAGVEFTGIPYLLSRYFGLKEFGAIAGVAFAGTLLFGALAPLFLNAVFDRFGSYDAAVYTIIGILIYSGVALLTFGPYRYTAAHHG
ncbi:MAG TPA: MFS transporter [Alphaproteobacteria bacterium]|nr:MFS transporter [Alphaproteobacteria bacterium]